jgi:phosphate transport system substrate-binding protein
MTFKALFCIGAICIACAPAALAQLLVPGAGPPTRLLQALANEFNSHQPALRVEVPPSTGMSGALDAIRTGKAELARLPRPLTPQEQASGLRQILVAREPIVFATGASVTLASLSRAQLAAVFAGRHADWAELGAQPGPVRVFYRAESESMLNIIRRSLPEFAQLRFSADGRMLNLDHETIEQLERFDWGIGWGSAGNVRAAKGLRILALDGVAPSAAALRDGRYPLFFDAVLIHKGDALSAPAKAFVDFVASPAGQAAIDAFGALPSSSR